MTTKTERKYPRVQVQFTKPSMTKQSFKDECNINKIMDKFQKSGALNHYAKHAPTYGDTTGVDYHDALNIIADANTMFEELPSSIRKRFDNDPETFLKFVEDDKNSEEMVKLGLKHPPVSNNPDDTVSQSENASASKENTETKDVGQEN
nr:MAG: internal scaffolding protein [Microvirus sp.]